MRCMTVHVLRLLCARASYAAIIPLKSVLTILKCCTGYVWKKCSQVRDNSGVYNAEVGAPFDCIAWVRVATRIPSPDGYDNFTKLRERKVRGVQYLLHQSNANDKTLKLKGVCT